MSYLPPDEKDKKAITPTRVLLWVVVGAVGLWLLGSGVFGIITGAPVG